MSDFEILSLIFTVIGLVLTAMNLNDRNKKALYRKLWDEGKGRG